MTVLNFSTDHFLHTYTDRYAIALNELGSETVHQYVGQEPSGRMFNELVLDYNSMDLVLVNLIIPNLLASLQDIILAK